MKGYYGLDEEAYPHVLITPGGIFFNPGANTHRSWMPQSLRVELPEDKVLGTKEIVDLETLVEFYLEHNNAEPESTIEKAERVVKRHIPQFRKP